MVTPGNSVAAAAVPLLLLLLLLLYITLESHTPPYFILYKCAINKILFPRNKIQSTVCLYALYTHDDGISNANVCVRV